MRRLLAAVLLLLPAPLGAQEPGRVADRKFVALTVASVLTAVADVELTQRCLRSGRCREGNPLMPTGRWRAYAVQAPLTLGATYLAYRWKKKGVRYWWVPQLSLSAGHGVGVAFGVRFVWGGG